MALSHIFYFLLNMKNSHVCVCVYLGKGKTDWSAADAPPIYHSFRIYASFWCTLNLRGLQLHVCDEACRFSIVRLSDFDFLLDSDLRLFPPPLSFLGFLFHFIYRRTSISITILRVWLACSNCIKHLSLVPMKNQSIAFLKLSYSFFFFFKPLVFSTQSRVPTFICWSVSWWLRW